MNESIAQKLNEKLGVGLDAAKALEDRCRGLTTAQALRAVAEAIDNPGKPIRVRDHFGPSSDRFLLDACAGVVQALDLVGFTFNRLEMTVSFDVSELREKRWGVRF